MGNRKSRIAPSAAAEEPASSLFIDLQMKHAFRQMVVSLPDLLTREVIEYEGSGLMRSDDGQMTPDRFRYVSLHMKSRMNMSPPPSNKMQKSLARVSENEVSEVLVLALPKFKREQRLWDAKTMRAFCAVVPDASAPVAVWNSFYKSSTTIKRKQTRLRNLMMESQEEIEIVRIAPFEIESHLRSVIGEMVVRKRLLTDIPLFQQDSVWYSQMPRERLMVSVKGVEGGVPSPYSILFDWIHCERTTLRDLISNHGFKPSTMCLLAFHH